MKETLIDIETYSEVDIGKCGLYRYATDPSFEILLVAWATDEGDRYTVDEVCKLMSVNPEWCKDLPLNAAGYKGGYYFKD